MQALAEPIPENAASGRSSVDADCAVELHKYVACFIGEKLCAIAASDVAEVVLPLTASSLPNAPVAVTGISAVRGDIVALLDVRRMLGIGAEEVLTQRSRSIVLKPQDGRTQGAFTVDRMWEVLQLAEDEIEPPENTVGIRRGTADTASGKVVVIDAQKLLDEMDFAQ